METLVIWHLLGAFWVELNLNIAAIECFFVMLSMHHEVTYNAHVP